MLAAAAALLAGNLALSLRRAVRCSASQATFSSPVRYALLPQHLRADELVDGNALLEGGTFLAILFGTIAGGIAVALDRGTEAACLLLVAVRGRRASPRAFACRAPRPRRPSCASAATRSPRPSAILRQAWERRDVKLSILGASWFWLVGAVFLSQIPAFAKETLGAGSGVVTLFLAAFSIGVGAGSVLCGRLMHGEVSARYVPLAATRHGALFARPRACQRWRPSRRPAASCSASSRSCRDFTGLRIFVDLTLIAICGGLFVVPLYAIIQQPQRRGGAGAHDRRASTS